MVKSQCENECFINDCDNMDINRSSFCTTDNVLLSFQYCEKKIKFTCSCFANNCGPSVILIPGIGYDSNYWLCLFKKLCPIANVYALDLYGSGISKYDTNPERVTLDRLTQDIVDFLNVLNLDEVYMVGHGFGGLLALNFAAIHSDRIIRLAVSGTSANFVSDTGKTKELNECTISPEILQLLKEALAIPTPCPETLKKIMISINNLIDPIDCNINDLLVEQYIDTLDMYRLYYDALTINIETIIPQISVPVLIMAGTRDSLAPLCAAEFLNKNIQNSALVEFYGQGNNFPILDYGLYNKNVFNFFFVKCDPCCAFFETILVNKQEKYECFGLINNINPCQNDYGCNKIKIPPFYT